MHRHAPTGERERDPAGPDPELERASAAGEPGEEVDGGIDDRRVEHLPVVVVARGDALAEVAVVVAHGRNVPSAGAKVRRVGEGYPVAMSERLQLTITFDEPDEEGWIVARVIEVPGAMSQGRSRAEARVNLIDALRLMLAPDDDDRRIVEGHSEPLELTLTA